MIESTSSWTKASGSNANVLMANFTIDERNAAPGMSACLASQASRREAMPLACGIPPIPAIHHPLALGDRELAEQEEASRGWWRSSWDCPAGVQERRLGPSWSLPGELDQLVLDLERAQSLEFAKRQQFSHSQLPCSECVRDDGAQQSLRMVRGVSSMTRTMPQIVSNVFPTA